MTIALLPPPSSSPLSSMKAQHTPSSKHSLQALAEVQLGHVTPPVRHSYSQPCHSPSFRRFHSHIALPQDTPTYPNSLVDRLKPWTPFILWGLTTAGFLLAITVWRQEVFEGLDHLSHYLRGEESHGYTILFLCIFVTTFPPLPLYSTFIILSGYTFGPWIGFAISYSASLVGAVFVYWVSLQYLGDYIAGVINNTGWTKQVMRAIERRPQLLFLIRVAPYPYNLMNSLLAASPSLSFKTYFWCTALSLFKLMIHTSAGSTIHTFAEYHTSTTEDEGSRVARYWSVFGIALCVGIFVYLSYLARKAVREEAAFRADHEAGLIDREMAQVTRSARGNPRT